MDNSTEDRSLRELAAQLPHDVARLVRGEAALVQAELAAGAGRMAAGAGMLAGALLFGLLALGAVTAAAVLALALVWPAWLAALVVGLTAGGMAGLLTLVGARLLRRAVRAPLASMESIREDLEWVRTRTHSGAR